MHVKRFSLLLFSTILAFHAALKFECESSCVCARTYVYKENLERSAEEIKGLSRASLKRGINVVDHGSSVYCPVIKKPHVDVLTSKPNTNTSSTSPVFGTNTKLTMPVLLYVSTQLTTPVPLQTRAPVKKLKT